MTGERSYIRREGWGAGVIKPSPGKQGQSGWGGAGTSNHIFAWDEVNSAEFRGGEKSDNYRPISKI